MTLPVLLVLGLVGVLGVPVAHADGPGPQDAQAARRPVLLLGTSNLTWQHLVAAADDPYQARTPATRRVRPASHM